MARPALAAYISGHGFGHFTRSEAVLAPLASHFEIHLRTNERALALARRAPWATSVTEVDVGPGVVQRGPLESDLPATTSALAAYVARFDALAASEAAALRALHARGVFADIPPLALEAARRAGVPSVALGNFSWSWIYEGFESCAALAAPLEAAERTATLLLELPFSGGFDHFPRREAVPLVVRHPTRSREAARALLPVPASEKRPIVLLSFGGFGDALDLGEAARHNEDFFFISFASSKVRPADARGSAPRSPVNLAALPHDHAFPHQDLVLGADAVLGKPGYGTVAETIVARRPFVISPRGDFREYAVLVRGIEENLACAQLTIEELLAGRWSAALRRAFAAPAPPSKLGHDGAAVAGRRIVELVSA